MPHDPKRQGVESEPHLKRAAIEPDQSNRLDEEPARATRVDDDPLATHAMSDEPALTWHSTKDAQQSARMDRFIELRDAAGRGERFIWWTGSILLAIPASIVGSLMSHVLVGTQGRAMSAVVLAPLVEQLLKVAGLLWLLEQRSWFVRRGSSLVIAAVITGALYGVVVRGGLGELIRVDTLEAQMLEAFLGVSPLPAWARATVVPMHVLTALCAGFGLMRIWNHGPRIGQPVESARATGWLLGAMTIHGLFAFGVYASVHSNAG
ncbi:MAG: PrsW family glutamic-type intramembrane protease [Planctomycetota bacterium]